MEQHCCDMKINQPQEIHLFVEFADGRQLQPQPDVTGDAHSPRVGVALPVDHHRVRHRLQLGKCFQQILKGEE